MLIKNDVSVALATYLVVVFVGLLFWLSEWLMPYRSEWNQPRGDIANDLLSGTVAYIILPIFLKPLFIAVLAGGTAWVAATWGGDTLAE